MKKIYIIEILLIVAVVVYMIVFSIDFNDWYIKKIESNREQIEYCIKGEFTEHVEAWERMCKITLKKGPENYDTLTMLMQMLRSSPIHYFVFFMVIITMFFGVYKLNSEFRSMNIKNCLTRMNYGKYIIKNILGCYKHALIWPLLIGVFIICAYCISGNFDYTFAVNGNASTFDAIFLKLPFLLFVLIYLSTLFIVGIFYINIGILCILKIKNLFVSIACGSLIYYALTMFTEVVLEGMILPSGYGGYVNYLDIQFLNNRPEVYSALLVVSVLAIVSSLIVYLVYRNKEKVLIALESCE